jgi:hypothetical protein
MSELWWEVFERTGSIEVFLIYQTTETENQIGEAAKDDEGAQ